MNTPSLFACLAFLLTVCSLTPTRSLAREVLYGSMKETLPLTFGTETLFRFPLEVKTITEAAFFEIKPANSEEPDYSVLAVKPRMTEKIADVTFVLADGQIIRTQLVSSPASQRMKQKKDSVYDFKPQEDALGNGHLAENREPLVVSELDLMRVMLSREKLSGFEVQDFQLKIESPPASPLSIVLVKKYTGSGVYGFIYELKNESPEQAVTLHLEQLAIGQPNLALLSQADRLTLLPQSQGQASDRQTLLRIVTKAGASGRKFVLPNPLEPARPGHEGAS